MLDPIALMLLTQLHREELLRQAAGEWLCDQALAEAASRTMPCVPRWRQIAEAFVAAIVEHVRLATRLESTGG